MSRFAFLSHASIDDRMTDELSEKLRALGVATWVDHSNIPPGANWNRSVEQALENCASGLLLLSPSASHSEECEAEWRTIIALKKRLYIAVVGRPNIPWRLRTFQYVDLNHGIDESLSLIGRAINQSDFPMNVAGKMQIQRSRTGTLIPIRRNIVRIVRLAFDISIEVFRRARNGFVYFLSYILGVPRDEFQIIDIEPGSTIVTVELPIEAAELLIDLTKADPDLFAQYRLTSGEIVARLETQHALPNRPDRVALPKEGRSSKLWRQPLSPLDVFHLLEHSGLSGITRKKNKKDDSDVA